MCGSTKKRKIGKTCVNCAATCLLILQIVYHNLSGSRHINMNLLRVTIQTFFLSGYKPRSAYYQGRINLRGQFSINSLD